MVAPTPFICYASQDVWIDKFEPLRDVEHVEVKTLPYALYLKIYDFFKAQEEKTLTYAKGFSRKITSITELMEECFQSSRNYRIQDLLKLIEVCDHVAFFTLFHLKSYKAARLMANRDQSAGTLFELSKETGEVLIQCMERQGYDWKKLADHLGYEQTQIFKFQNFKEFYHHLLVHCPHLTVARLIFEANLLDFKELSVILKSLRISEIRPLESSPLFDRPVTLFDIQALDICLGADKSEYWPLVCKPLFLKYFKNNSTKDSVYLGRDLKTMLWKSLTVRLRDLVIFLDQHTSLQKGVHTFLEKIRQGQHISKSSTGVTYDEIAHLGKIDQDFSHLKEWDTFLRDLPLISIYSFPLTFRDALLLHWQVSEYEKLDLQNFYKKILQKLIAYPHLAPLKTQFTRQYRELRPSRVFDPELMKTIRDKVEEMSQLRFEENLCEICFVNSINAVVTPCGHLQYCLDCLNKVTACPTCREEKIRIFKVYRGSQHGLESW